MVGALTVTFNEAQLTEVIKEYLENEGVNHPALKGGA